MNAYKETPSELLNLLVDGELDAVRQTELYSALQQSEELRGELDELLAIRESVRKDTEAFSPPADAGRGVFQRLGFTPPAGTLNTPLWKKLWIPAAAAVVASLFTALMITNPGSDDLTDNTPIEPNHSKIPVSYSVPGEQMNSEIVESENNFDNNNSTDNRVSVKTVNTPNAENNNNRIVSNNSSRNGFTLNNSDLETNNSFLSNVNNAQTFGGINLIAANAYADPSFGSINVHPGNMLMDNFALSSNKEGTMLLFVRGIAASSFNSVPDETQSTMFSNMSAGAFYKISENVRLGGEVSQEPFAQEFLYNGNQVTQNPMLICITAGARFETEKIEAMAGAQPYAQLLAGGALDNGALTGGVGKAQLGLQWVQASGFGAFIGGEVTGLLYEQNDLLFSGRGGFTFGISFGF